MPPRGRVGGKSKKPGLSEEQVRVQRAREDGDTAERTTRFAFALSC